MTPELIELSKQAALSAKSVPDAPFMDLEDSDYVAKRFRLILSKLGISTPESNEIGDPRFIDISFIPTIASMTGEQK